MTSLARDILDVLFAGVWQGACIAFVVAATLALIGYRVNAGTRYVVLQATLAATAIVPIATTLPNVTQPSFDLRIHDIASPSENGKSAAEPAWITARRIDVVLSDEAVLLLIAAWVGGVSLFASRMVVGPLQLARLLRRSHPLTIRGGVEVFASTEIAIPLAIGFAPPAIIVPASLAAQADEAFESIVLHELAHVRRGDAYANACERAIQALLYVNPIVWLLIRAITLERETACDDWAVARSHDLDGYTRNLASFAVRAATRSADAYAAPGLAHAIVTRIQRLQQRRRNGAISLSRFAIGGFTIVLLTIALTLNSFGPAVAFASQASVVNATVAAAKCAPLEARYLSGPAPVLQSRLPNGLKTVVRVRVSSSGKAIYAALYKTSGDAAFDRAVITAAKKGTYAPEMRDCRPLAAPFMFDAVTG